MPFQSIRSVVRFFAALLVVAHSDLDDRSWRQASGQAIERYAAGHCGIPVIRAEAFSAAEFDKKFSERSPVLVRGLTAKESAAGHWDRAAFVSAFGALKGTTAVPLYTAQFGLPASQKKKRSVRVAKYIEKLDANVGAGARLFFDRSRGKLGKAIMALHGAPDALAAMTKGDNEMPVISIGASGQGLTLHQHAQTWLSLLRGRKLWFLMAPDALQGHSAYETLALRPPAEWPSDFLPSVLEHSKGLHVCEQLPGDVMYIPSLWYHATENDGDSLGAGMQQMVPFPSTFGGAEGAHARYPRSAFVRDLVARDSIDKLTAIKEEGDKKKVSADDKKKILAALEEIEAAIELEPLDFFRRFNELKARARYAEIRGEDKDYITLMLFRGWKDIEQVAVKAVERSVLSRPQLVAVLVRIAEEIRTTLPWAEAISKDILDKIKADAKEADPSTFEVLWSNVPAFAFDNADFYS